MEIAAQANPEPGAPEIEEIYRAKWTAATRKAYYEEHPENFAGDGDSFPIKDGSDVADAWGLAGHADDPDCVRTKIKAIAKRLGFEGSLPDTAKEDEKGERMNKPAEAQVPVPAESVLDTASAAPDLSRQQDEIVVRNDFPTTLDIYAPIRSIDRERREVTVTATAERLDAYRTIIGFEASQDAFQRWPGNIREMHDPTKAVGRALRVEPRAEEKEIDVTLRVSPGAESTWQKVLDGTLCGASIGAKNGKWGRRKVDGEEIPFLERYDLVELSLVDNPACPGCTVKLVRSSGADILMSEELDNSEPELSAAEPTTTRKGAPINKENRAHLHAIRDHTLGMCADAGCDECKTMMTALDDDGDGDTDLPRVIGAEIQRQLAPVVQRMQVTLTQHALKPAQATLTTTEPSITREQIGEEIQRRIETVESSIRAGLDEVRALMLERIGEVKDLAITIANQPSSGGNMPLANLTPVDKRLANGAPPATNNQALDDIAAITRASEMGLFKDQESQTQAAARIIALQRQQMATRG